MLSIYNTLTKSRETLLVEESGSVGIYTCGPTVYRRSHIGNLRSYLMSDWLRRSIQSTGAEVFHIKNITDVGHMRQERVDLGEDKILAAAIAEGRPPKEIADEYTDIFMRDERALGIIPADVFPRATEHIPEMIDMIVKLIAKGFAYIVEGNVYFSVSSFSDYGKLSGNLTSQLLPKDPNETDTRKKDPRDFALWKEAEPGRSMKWDSPWGPGFPGWHIECSAMASRYLGSNIDIHTGGVDNIFPHHECEIAQSEAVFERRHTNVWLHGQHLLVDGIKMAKSSQNDYTLEGLEQRGFDPMAFRYLCATARYRNRLNFTLQSLDAAQRGLRHLRLLVQDLDSSKDISSADLREAEGYRAKFLGNIEDDLNLPSALATTWFVLRSDLSDTAKLQLLGEFDEVLGLDLLSPDQSVFPENVRNLALDRSKARQAKNWPVADDLRDQLRTLGVIPEDGKDTYRLRMLQGRELIPTSWQCVSRSEDLEFADVPDPGIDLSVILVNTDQLQDTLRCVNSIILHASDLAMEIVIVQNGMRGEIDSELELMYHSSDRVRILHVESQIGDSAAKNVGIRVSRGSHIVLMDSSVEVTGDIFRPLRGSLQDKSVGVVGPWGLVSKDLKEFNETTVGKVDAMQAYCLAFRRDAISEVGMLDEAFRFYRHGDLEYSFRFKYHGYAVVADGNLPMVRHVHRDWERFSEEDRELLSAANFRKFLRAWGHHHDLLEANVS